MNPSRKWLFAGENGKVLLGPRDEGTPMDTQGKTAVGMRSRLASSAARAVLRVEDLDRAKRFYGQTLGLAVEDEFGGQANALVLVGDGTMFELYERPGIPASQSTVMAFHADDFDATIADLRARGVVFEEYDIPDMGLRTVNGVADLGAMKAAWFKDTEGNILSVGTL
jgi:predicted enzyme related to lactoylglutathione lyase